MERERGGSDITTVASGPVPPSVHTSWKYVTRHTITPTPLRPTPIQKVAKKNSKLLVMCAVGGTLDTNVTYRRDKKLFAGWWLGLVLVWCWLFGEIDSVRQCVAG